MTRVGILGAGGMGTTHARQYNLMPDVEFAFYDTRSDRSVEFGQRYPNAIPLPSVHDLMNWADAVDICVPTDIHAEFALQAIALGKALLIEKPICRQLEEAVKVVEAATKANLPLMVAQVVRYFPEFELGHKMVKDGKVGVPAAARTRRGGPAPQGGVDHWFQDAKRSGGVLLDLGVHDFDWLRWTLGEVKFLYSRSMGEPHPNGMDYALTTLTFDQGTVAHVETTWADPGGFRVAFEVCGSGGMIEFDSRTCPSLRTVKPGFSRLDGPLAPTDDPYYRQCRSFIDALQNNTDMPVTGYDGLMSLSIACAAAESAETGKVVSPSRQF